MMESYISIKVQETSYYLNTIMNMQINFALKLRVR